MYIFGIPFFSHFLVMHKTFTFGGTETGVVLTWQANVLLFWNKEST